MDERLRLFRLGLARSASIEARQHGRADRAAERAERELDRSIEAVERTRRWKAEHLRRPRPGIE